MASDNRKPYENESVLDQDFLDRCQDNLVNDLQLIVEIEDPQGGTIRVSDRNKYVGGYFYEARLEFPTITRTVGEFLSPQLEFSSISLELNNADGKYNRFLPAGDDYDGWIGNKVEVKLGLRNVSGTYKTIFSGQITEEGGLERTVKSIIISARDDFDELNITFPTTVFTLGGFPNIEADKENLVLPVVYGDWTVNVEAGLASIPAFAVNGLDDTVNGVVSFDTNLQLVVSENANTFFDTSEVYLVRGDAAWRFNAADITSVAAGNNSFQINQQSNNMIAVTPEAANQLFEYASGDTFLVKVRGKDLGSYDDNIIEQAKDILITYSSATLATFAANWASYRDKASPAESAISSFKSRVWVQEPINTLEYVLSMLEQVRLEVFLNRDQKLEILSNHLDDFVAVPSFQIKNWDVEKDSFRPKLDDRNNFNRAKGQFNGLPNRQSELYQETAVFKATLAIAQTGKETSKRLLFPNLYDAAVVESQVEEILRLTAGYIEDVYCSLTWRSMLLDIGNFVMLNVDIQGTVFKNVPAMVREIGYDPEGLKIPVRLRSLQMIPFTGYAPTYNGITGGANVTIVKET